MTNLIPSEEILDKSSLHALLNHCRDMCREHLDNRFPEFVHLSKLIRNPALCPEAYAWYRIAEKIASRIYSWKGAN
jgi:hypothetical protein